ncbi:MAG: hypothetical protein M3512_15680 [Bacteroidota bacterium]|nr:hypothetical protein [Bacteroidota bacterium]
MKKIFFIILITLLNFAEINAQNGELRWGPEHNNKDFDVEHGYIGKVGDSFYSLRSKDKVLYLSKYRTADMSREFEKPIGWNDDKKNSANKNLTFSSLRLFKNNFILFFEDLDKKTSTQIMYGQKINFEGNFEGELVKVDERDKERRSRDGSFKIIYSEDSLNFLVVKNPNFEKYSNEKFNFKIFNASLKPLHNLEVSLPYLDKDFALMNTLLSKELIIYLLARIEVPRKDKKKDEATFYNELVSIDPAKGATVKKYEIKLDKKYIKQVDVYLDKSENIRCFGFYSELRDNGKPQDGIKGAFFFELNKSTKNIQKQSTKDFSAALVEELSGKRRAKNEKGLLNRYMIRNVFEREDGGTIILVEESYIVEVTSQTRNGSTTTSYHYHHNAIVSVNISEQGNIQSYNVVPKLQHTVNDDRFGSFYASYTKGKVYIVYNDEASNAVTKTYDKTMKNFMKSVPVMVTLSESGKFDKVMVSTGKKRSDFIVTPRITNKINDNEALVYAYKLSKGCCFIGGGKAKTTRYGLLRFT